MGEPPALSAVPRPERGTAPPPAARGGRRLPEADGEGGRLASIAQKKRQRAAGALCPCCQVMSRVMLRSHFFWR